MTTRRHGKEPVGEAKPRHHTQVGDEDLYCSSLSTRHYQLIVIVMGLRLLLFSGPSSWVKMSLIGLNPCRSDSDRRKVDIYDGLEDGSFADMW